MFLVVTLLLAVRLGLEWLTWGNAAAAGGSGGVVAALPVNLPAWNLQRKKKESLNSSMFPFNATIAVR